MPEIAVGLDPGFGNMKAVAGDSTVVMPSLVALARRVGLAAVGLRIPKATIVRMGDHEYAIGSGAPLRGTAYESIDDMRFLAPPTLALMLGTVAKVVGEKDAHVALMVGLPVSALEGSEPGAGMAKALRQRLLGRHVLEIDGAAVTLDIERVWVRAQPLGVWADWAVTPSGDLHAGARRTLVGIVDIGFHTVDLMGIEGGQAHLGMMAGVDLGVRVLLEDAAVEQDLPYHELLRRYNDGSLTIDDGVLAGWTSKLGSLIRRRWAGVRPQLVIMAGGGVALLQERGLLDRLRRAIRCDTYVPLDPIATGARGLEKLARALLARERARVGAHAEVGQGNSVREPAGDV